MARKRKRRSRAGLMGYFVDAVCPEGPESYGAGSGPADWRKIRQRAQALQKRGCKISMGFRPTR